MTAPTWISDYSQVNVCMGENLTTDENGQPMLAPWAVPRLVADYKALSGGDLPAPGANIAITTLPGRQLIDLPKVRWRNDTPLDQEVIIRVTRASKSWTTANPNAVQFRDRWSFVIGDGLTPPAEPIVTGIYNSQCGSAVDFGTNTIAEPNIGKQWMWHPVNMMDEWVGPVPPGDTLEVHYRCYVWTPPPYSDNANVGNPAYSFAAGWARVSLIAIPQQGTVVAG